MNPTDITEVPPNLVEELLPLLKEMDRLEASIEKQEKTLADNKAKLQALKTEHVPELMLANGVKGIRLTDGTFVTVEKFYQAKIPDDRRNEAFQWLDANEHGGLIKTEVVTIHSRGDLANAKRVYALLKKNGFVPMLNESVHVQTLKAFVREQIEAQHKIPLDLFGVYIGNVVKVKKAS